MISLTPVTDKTRFWNLNQKYLYEMTQFYDDQLDAEGNLHYGHFESYFTGDPERKAYYLEAGGVTVGFVMLNRFSHLGDEIDHAVAEFTVFPMYRRRGYATEAVKLIFGTFPGKWEVKYTEKNQKAAAFWIKMTAPYTPEVTALNDCERVLTFTVQTR